MCVCVCPGYRVSRRRGTWLDFHMTPELSIHWMSELLHLCFSFSSSLVPLFRHQRGDNTLQHGAPPADHLSAHMRHDSHRHQHLMKSAAQSEETTGRELDVPISLKTRRNGSQELTELPKVHSRPSSNIVLRQSSCPTQVIIIIIIIIILNRMLT